MKAAVRTFVAALVTLAPALAAAHAGHTHKVMGAVASFDAAAGRLQVKTTDGRTVDLTVDAKTRYLKGAAAGAATDLTTGTRVVVSYMEKDSVKTVTEVRIGAAEKAAAAPKAKPPRR